jgi:hypothetical protein
MTGIFAVMFWSQVAAFAKPCADEFNAHTVLRQLPYWQTPARIRLQ